MSKSDFLPQYSNNQSQTTEHFSPNVADRFDSNEYQTFIKDLKQLAQLITIRSSKLSEFCSIIQNEIIYNYKIPDYLDKYIIDDFIISSPIKKTSLSSVTVAAVDGGVTIGSMIGIDIIGLKATGVYFKYGQNKISRVNYYPKKHQSIKLIPSYHNFSNNDLNLYASLRRSILELKTALLVLNEAPSTIDYLLMDGTHSLKRIMSSNIEINRQTGIYFAFLRKLVIKSNSLGTKLAFIVKDTRNSTFTELLSKLLPHIINSIPSLYNIDYRGIIESVRDSNLFFKLLPPKTRSFIINRTYNQQDQVKFSFIPYSTFLKVIENDNPLRIDFIGALNANKNEIKRLGDELSQIVLSLSNFNPFYSLPAPIIEVDARSRINLKEFNKVLESLQSLTFGIGSSIDTKPLKRSSSPFKFKS